MNSLHSGRGSITTLYYLFMQEVGIHTLIALRAFVRHVFRACEAAAMLIKYAEVNVSFAFVAYHTWIYWLYFLRLCSIFAYVGNAVYALLTQGTTVYITKYLICCTRSTLWIHNYADISLILSVVAVAFYNLCILVVRSLT